MKKEVKVFVGDESGLLKTVSWKKKKSAVVEQWPDQSIDKGRAVTKMIMQGDVGSDSRAIWLARKDSSVECWRLSSESEKIEKIKQISPSSDVDSSPLIGLGIHDERVVTCHGDGKIQVCMNDTVTMTSLGLADLSVARVSSGLNQIITGGKENDFTVWDLESIVSTAATAQSTFKAKNVKNDFLDLRVPIHITDLDFVKEHASQYVVGTMYHQLRLYDTKVQRRPVISASIGEHPIQRIIHGESFNVYFSDTIDSKPAWKITDIAGAVTDLFYEPSNGLLYSTSLDRHVRAHDTKAGSSLVFKSYLKQRLNCVVAHASSMEEEEAAGDEIDEILDEIEVIDDSQFLRDAKRAKISSKEEKEKEKEGKESKMKRESLRTSK